MANELEAETPAGERPVNADRYRRDADDPEKAEHSVRVQRLESVPEAAAVNEVGLFGNQNTVCEFLALQVGGLVRSLV